MWPQIQQEKKMQSCLPKDSEYESKHNFLSKDRKLSNVKESMSCNNTRLKTLESLPPSTLCWQIPCTVVIQLVQRLITPSYRWKRGENYYNMGSCFWFQNQKAGTNLGSSSSEFLSLISSNHSRKIFQSTCCKTTAATLRS